MTYKRFIDRRLEDFNPGEPILTSILREELAEAFGISLPKASEIITVVLGRIVAGETKSLERYGPGIYYIKDEEHKHIDIQRTAEILFIESNQGYETGSGLLREFGLLPRAPAERVMVTQKAKKAKEFAPGIYLRPPKVEVDQWAIYLKILDLMELSKGRAGDKAYIFIKDRGLDYEKLLALAVRYYPSFVAGDLTLLAVEHLQN